MSRTPERFWRRCRLRRPHLDAAIVLRKDGGVRIHLLINRTHLRIAVTAFAVLFASPSAKADITGYQPVREHFQKPARVWVNSSSSVYHCEGTRYYGATKRGTYMSETEARAKGNRPARGQPCGPLPSAGESVLPLGSGPSEVPGSNVWVNTTSGVYHCPGSRYYRNTKRGKLMTEANARSAGHRPAYGKACS